MSLLSKFQQGCTGLSWAFKKPLPGEPCCDEHDLAYEQGGSLAFKMQQDWILAKCINIRNQGGRWNRWNWQGKVKALGALLMVTVNPYAYIVWHRQEVTA